MKALNSIQFLIAITLFILIPLKAITKSNYKLLINESDIVVHGTSTIHDWEMPANKFNCLVEINKDSDQSLQIGSVDLNVEAESILSNNKIMDNKTHDALKTDKYPKIIFDFTEIQKVENSGNRFKGEAVGNLNIAGITKAVKVPYEFTFADDKKIEVQGSVDLKMTDFGIKPPTAMLGTLKTGNEIKVAYKLVFINNSEMSPGGIVGE